MTPEEKHLWYDFLKKLPISVKRQKNIQNFIIDFYIAEKKIAIEIDGIQYEMPENKFADQERDDILSSYGIKVLRYTNEDIRKRFDIVQEDILENLGLSVADLKDDFKN